MEQSVKSSEGQHSVYCVLSSRKKKVGWRGCISASAWKCTVVFCLFVFFWKILKITMVADVEENSVPGEQKWRETFPYLTLLNLKLWELETKN